MKKLLLFTLLLTLTFFKTELSAQMVTQPIVWSSKIVALENNLYEIQIIGVLDENRSEWHIYDLGPYVDGPTPTTLVFDNLKGAELIGKPYLLTKAKKKFDEMFGMEIGICEENVIVAQKIKVTSPDSVSILAIIEWQACDDQSCLPPTDKEFKIKLPGAGKKAVAAPATSTQAPSSAKPDIKTENKPVTEEVKEQAVAVEAVPAVVEPAQTGGETISSPSEELASAPQDEPARKSIWGVIFEAIIWGFVALLTPCVFPMVPMTVSFFLKNSHSNANSDSEDTKAAKRKSANGRIMATFFGASIILLYTLPIAAIIMITYFAGGEAVTADIFNWLATHWVPNVLFFLIFMIFAASFFGAFEIVLPSWLINKTDSKSDKGGYIGVFFMALTLVLVSFSCTGPIVGTILIKSTQGEIWEPIITMLAFSTAFAIPFTIFAFAPSLLKDLPKSGGWLNSVKVVLGFIEVALGFKFLSVADQTYHWGLLDREIYLAIWIVTFTLMGFYLLGKLRFAHDTPEQHITVKRLALSIITFSFVVYMIPGMWGAPLKGLSGYMPPMSSQDFQSAQLNDLKSITVSGTSGESSGSTFSNDLGFKPKYSDFLHLPHGLEGFFEYNEAIEYAKRVGKPLFVDFTGHGCVNCREMEARVWSDPKVLKLLKERFVLLALYADDKKEAQEKDWITTESGRVLKSIGKINANLAMSKYGVNAQPYYAIIDPATEAHLTTPRGYNLDIQAFITFLETGADNYKK